MFVRDEDLAFALQLADVADAITLAAFTGQPLRHNEKFDGTPVTETDQVVEATLREHVERTHHGDGFLGEEFGAVATAIVAGSLTRSMERRASLRAAMRGRLRSRSRLTASSFSE